MKSPYGWEQLSFWWRLWPILKREKFDILHVQDPTLADWCRRFRRVGLITTDVILANGTEEDMEFLGRFPFVQELSPHYLERHAGSLPQCGLRWGIPNFVDTETFSPGDTQAIRRSLSLPDDAFVVLSVGAVNADRKRTDHLVREVGQAGRPDLLLIQAGICEDESARGLVRRAAETLGARFRFMEDVPHDRMPDLYRAADVFVMCSLEEILGISFLEAMACGRACIGHRFPVTQWVIGDGGECIDMKAEGVLSSRLHELTRDWCGGRGAQGRRRAEECFSKRVVVDRILEMYERVRECRN